MSLPPRRVVPVTRDCNDAGPAIFGVKVARVAVSRDTTCGQKGPEGHVSGRLRESTHDWGNTRIKERLTMRLTVGDEAARQGCIACLPDRGS